MRPDDNCHDESLLLDLIEGSIDPVAQAKLESALTEEPGLAARIEAMRRDRALLQSGRIPEPSCGMVERALQAARQPARIDETAAQWRRRYQHHELRPRIWAGAAAAAAVIVIVGVWILLERQPEQPSVNDGTMAVHHQVDSVLSARVPLTADGEGANQADAGMKHAEAEVRDARAVPQGALAAANEETPMARPGGHGVVVMPVALVIRTKDAAATVASLRGLVRESRASAALVSNLTRESVHELQVAEFVEHARRPSSTVADGTGAEPPALGNRLGLDRAPAERIASVPRARKPGQVPAGELLEGSRELAASYLQQLDFADEGAMLTLTISLQQLNAWLARVQETAGAATTLRPWGEPQAAGSALARRQVDPAAMWLEQLDRIRDVMRSEPARSMALLPIVIEDDPTPRSPKRP